MGNCLFSIFPGMHFFIRWKEGLETLGGQEVINQMLVLVACVHGAPLHCIQGNAARCFLVLGVHSFAI